MSWHLLRTVTGKYYTLTSNLLNTLQIVVHYHPWIVVWLPGTLIHLNTTTFEASKWLSFLLHSWHYSFMKLALWYFLVWHRFNLQIGIMSFAFVVVRSLFMNCVFFFVRFLLFSIVYFCVCCIMQSIMGALYVSLIVLLCILCLQQKIGVNSPGLSYTANAPYCMHNNYELWVHVCCEALKVYIMWPVYIV